MEWRTARMLPVDTFAGKGQRVLRPMVPSLKVSSKEASLPQLACLGILSIYLDSKLYTTPQKPASFICVSNAEQPFLYHAAAVPVAGLLLTSVLTGKSLSIEWLGFARVNTVSPGFVNTGITGSVAEDVMSAIMDKVPMGWVMNVMYSDEISNMDTDGHL